MIRTLSLCNTCYKKVPARIYEENGMAVMEKECDIHGTTKAVCERSWLHWSTFYERGTLGNNNNIIVHMSDTCNMNCPWCYYPVGKGKDQILGAEYLDAVLGQYRPDYNLLLSGGEPTVAKNYLDYNMHTFARGWKPTTITNMVRLGDKEFFKKTLNKAWVDPDGTYRFAMSMQHPKNYSKEHLMAKFEALANIEEHNLKAMCVMFSVSSLDELPWIKEFYDETRHLYGMMRIRTLFHSWENAGEKDLYLSDLYQAFQETFSDYTPVINRDLELSNAYCLYMKTKEARYLSLSSGPTINNIDYHLCSRPVMMLARDHKCYPVPIAQIINEGIDRGWKDGFKLEGEVK
jgi:hypothetical protein